MCIRDRFQSSSQVVEDDLEKKIKEADAQVPQLEIIQAQFELKAKQEATNLGALRRDFVRLGLPL